MSLHVSERRTGFLVWMFPSHPVPWTVFPIRCFFLSRNSGHSTLGQNSIGWGLCIDKHFRLRGRGASFQAVGPLNARLEGCITLCQHPLDSYSLSLEKSWLCFCQQVNVGCLGAAWRWGMGNVVPYAVSQVIYNSPIFSPSIYSHPWLNGLLCNQASLGVLSDVLVPSLLHHSLKGMMRLWLPLLVMSINFTSTFIFQKLMDFSLYSVCPHFLCVSYF